MDKQLKKFNDLILAARDYMVNQLNYAPKTVGFYVTTWKRIRGYMYENDIKQFNRKVGQKYYEYCLEKYDGIDSGYLPRIKIMINILIEFCQTGKINPRTQLVRKEFVFTGKIGKVISSFIEYKKNECKSSSITIRFYNRNLLMFNEFCNKENIKTITSINLILILKYIKCIKPTSSNTVRGAIDSIRNFIKYLDDKETFEISFYSGIPIYKRIDQPKIPSTYTKEEIKKLISSIERSTPIGKRNYAMILLASKMGLRASDICNLKFENLLWDKNIIELTQIKTGKKLILPILADVGNSIIDYLKFGRRNSNEQFVFLTERPPFGPCLSSNVVTHVVQRAITNSKINIKGRRFGPHALRHSLALRMLDESTILPVISEVLGHSSTETTRYYLRIDLKSMRNCVLEVPNVSKTFYEQKGGFFYA